jgi:hypothetical protein
MSMAKDTRIGLLKAYPIAAPSTGAIFAGQVLLLYCPKQGGWHTGVWADGRWVARIAPTIELEPTHWMLAPPDLAYAE